MRPSPEALLPSPGVRFGPDFAARVGGLVARLSGRARREGTARAPLFGAGQEFVGYRPYAAGDDVRHLDWTLLARHDQPFVRVHRREASEDWAVLLDASASMGVGVPGKLQRAAEVAAAIAAAGLRAGARVTLWASAGDERRAPGPGGGDRRLVLRRAPGALGSALVFLESLRASGAAGTASLFDPARLAGARRVFAVGDLFDLEPDHLPRIARRGRELVLVRILAPEELVAPVTDAVEWVDPERGERLRVRVDARTESRYERAVSDELERWRALAARHRVPHGTWSSARPFEDIAEVVLAA